MAVNNVSLHVNDGEFLVLLGPSGCGKSTALRMIAGLEEVTDGEIRIGDRIVNDVAPKDRDIAMVFQNYALYPHMSVYKNMAFGLELRYGGNSLHRTWKRLTSPTDAAKPFSLVPVSPVAAAEPAAAPKVHARTAVVDGHKVF